MSIINKLMLILPHTEFESPELKDRFTTFMNTLDQDLDNSGFDTASNTDDMFESLEECINGLEYDVVLEIRSASDIEQDAINSLEEELEDEEITGDAEVLATGEPEVEDDEDEDEVVTAGTVVIEKTEIIVTLEESDKEILDLVDDEDEFESELEAEVEEYKKLEEIQKAATGEVATVATDVPPSSSDGNKS